MNKKNLNIPITNHPEIAEFFNNHPELNCARFVREAIKEKIEKSYKM